ncbi:MAG: hypothetical protein H0Z34_16005 [Brevibacillus sp.]|nr:hypothetical protein [Brevibacillus sp.]
MLKTCSRCGREMGITLRNVVYRNRVKIKNVPVHVCTNKQCAHSQVVEAVKDELKSLMNDLGHKPVRQDIEFERICEFSKLLVMVAEHCEETAVTSSVEQKVRDLLDLYLLAHSLGDQKWMHEIRERLTCLIC